MTNLELQCWVRAEQYTEIDDWCIEYFGKSNRNVTWTLLANNEIGGHIYFENAEDAMAFKLRWL